MSDPPNSPNLSANLAQAIISQVFSNPQVLQALQVAMTSRETTQGQSVVQQGDRQAQPQQQENATSRNMQIVQSPRVNHNSRGPSPSPNQQLQRQLMSTVVNYGAGPSNRPAPPPTPVLNIMTGDGSASSPTSLVKLEGAPSRLRTSQERNADRNKLFSPYPSASGRKDMKNEGSFNVIIVILTQPEPATIPDIMELEELQEHGFGPKEITFRTTMDEAAVMRTISQCHPGVKALYEAGMNGTLQLYRKEGPGKSRKLTAHFKPMMNGRELKKQKEVYLAPPPNANIPELHLLSGIVGGCGKCFRPFDVAVLHLHESLCSGRPAFGEGEQNPSEGSTARDSSHGREHGDLVGQGSGYMEQNSVVADSAAAGLQRYEDLSAQVPRAAQPQGGLRSVDGQHRYEDLSAQGAQVAQSQDMDTAPSSTPPTDSRDLATFAEGLQIMATHKAKMVSDDVGVNFREFTRTNLLEQVHNATNDTTFMTSIKKTLRVKITGEDGIDAGGLARHLLSTILKLIEESLPSFCNYLSDRGYYLGIPDSEDFMLTPEYIEQRIFAYGLFSGLGAIQQDLCPKFIADWILRLQGNNDHPYLKGLQVFELAQLVLEKEAVRSVFVETVWTKDMVDASFVLHRQPEGNELLQLKESACFDYFIEVLHDVVDGLVSDVTMKQAYQFITGSWIVPINLPIIEVAFDNRPTNDGLTRWPYASTCTDRLMLGFVSSKKEMEFVLAYAIRNSGPEFHRS